MATTNPQSPRAHNASSTMSPSNRPSSPMSRRTSMMMAPQPNQTPIPSSDEPSIPMRHPRPLTAAELHLELEKEQEAVVNRLQRELSTLRAQTSSVLSTTSTSSSASTSAIHDTPTSSVLDLQGSTHPTPSRRHRSSSSLSIRNDGRTSQASVDRARDAGIVPPGSGSRSRQNSYSVNNGLATGSVSMPAPPRASLSRQVSERATQSPALPFRESAQPAYFGGGGNGSGGANVGAVQSPGGNSKYEEAREAREKLEGARRENERLSAKIRELELRLRERERGGSTGAGGGVGAG